MPVKALFDYLKGGETLAEFLDDFPTVSKQQAVKALELAGEDLIDAAVAGRISRRASHLMRFTPFRRWGGRVSRMVSFFG